MSYERLAYDDQDSTSRMHEDCTACASSIALPQQRIEAADVTSPAPSLTWDTFPEQTRKPAIEVSEAAAHLANRMHLHLD